MFVPGDKERFLNKAAAAGVDAVFLDLEDGVLPANKESARTLVCDALAIEPFKPERYVRINSIGSPWYEDDLQAVVRAGAGGVCVPKVDSVAQVEAVTARLTELESNNGRAEGSVMIVAAIESATAILSAPTIAGSSPRVVALMLGAEDLALDLGLSTRRGGAAAELLYARSAVVYAAAAAGVMSIDGVFPDLDDPEGFLADAVLARELGFTSKSTFNPRQIEVLNETFSPSPGEISYAQEVVKAFEAAAASGDASVAVGGQLVDMPIVRRAERVLAIATTLGLL